MSNVYKTKEEFERDLKVLDLIKTVDDLYQILQRCHHNSVVIRNNLGYVSF